jgi:hypothetical protein
MAPTTMKGLCRHSLRCADCSVFSSGIAICDEANAARHRHDPQGDQRHFVVIQVTADRAVGLLHVAPDMRRHRLAIFAVATDRPSGGIAADLQDIRSRLAAAEDRTPGLLANFRAV